VCDEVEPELLASDPAAPQHTAACHFSDRLIDMRPDDVFTVTSIDVDTDEVVVADTELAETALTDDAAPIGLSEEQS
jgi:hypothetical protein